MIPEQFTPERIAAIKGQHKAFILRTRNADMSSRGGFVWPREGHVAAPDWEANDECGQGLHGFLWGEGNGALASDASDAVWLVAGIAEWIDLKGKVKFPSAEVIHSGTHAECEALLRSFGTSGAIVYGTATAGEGGTATAGDYGTLCISHWDGKRKRIIIAYVGEGDVKADTAYRIRDGKLVEAVA